MTRMVWLSLVLVWSAGCDVPTSSSDSGVVDAGRDAGEVCPDLSFDYPGCQNHCDCPGGYVCDIEPGAACGACLQGLCTGDEWCKNECGTSFRKCDVRRGLCLDVVCTDDAECQDIHDDSVCLGQECALATRCQVDGDCAEGELCMTRDDGAFCVGAPWNVSPSTCETRSATLLAVDGDVVAPRVTGFNSDGSLTKRASYTFTSTQTIDVADDGKSLTAACAGPSACRAAVDVHGADGSVCGAFELVAFPPKPAGQRRVVVVDEATLLPVDDATVVLGTDSDDRQFTPNADGVVLVDSDDSTVLRLVSAVAPGHTWVSLIDPAGDDILLRLPRTMSTTTLEGDADFSESQSSGDVEAGLFGASRPLPWSKRDLLGDDVAVVFNIEGVTQGDQEVVLPAHLILRSPTDDRELAKATFSTTHNEGRAPLVWGLGKRVRLADVGTWLSSQNSSDEASASADLWRSIHSPLPGLAHGVSTVVGEAIVVQVRNESTRIARVPHLPALRPGGDGAADHPSSAWVMHGANVVGEGFMPLGVAHEFDDPTDTGGADGVLSSDAEGVVDGEVRVFFASGDDVAAGHDQVTVVAVDFDDPHLAAGAHARTDTNDDAPTQMPAFAGLPSAVYDLQSTASGNPLLQLDVVDADLVRVVLANSDGAEWHVYMSSTTAASDLDVADVAPMSGADPRHQLVEVATYKLEGGLSQHTASSVSDLFKLRVVDVDNVEQFASSWAKATCSTDDGSACLVVP